MVKKYLLIPLLYLLLGCTAQVAPEYVVTLTSPYQGTCTGVVVDSETVWTAAHCLMRFKMDTVHTQSGVQVSFRVSLLDPQNDFALIRLDEPISMGEYPTFGERDTYNLAYAFGACPRFSLLSGRPVFPQPLASFVDDDCEVWVASVPICGGDSGGVVMQDGVVVGMIQRVQGYDLSGSAFGYYVCVRPFPISKEGFDVQ